MVFFVVFFSFKTKMVTCFLVGFSSCKDICLANVHSVFFQSTDMVPPHMAALVRQQNLSRALNSTCLLSEHVRKYSTIIDKKKNMKKSIL